MREDNNILVRRSGTFGDWVNLGSVGMSVVLEIGWLDGELELVRKLFE